MGLHNEPTHPLITWLYIFAWLAAVVAVAVGAALLTTYLLR